LDIRLHYPEDDHFAAQEGIAEHNILVKVRFAGDGLICGYCRKDGRGT
jgi:hypothetical protein